MDTQKQAAPTTTGAAEEKMISDSAHGDSHHRHKDHGHHHHDHGHSHGDHDHDDDHGHGHDHDHPFDWIEGGRIALVALAALAVWMQIWEPFAAVSVIGIVGLLIGGWPIFKEAFENIVERRMTMELSMTIAIVAAAAIGEFLTALIITLFVLVAEVLEGMTVGRGRKAIRDLLEFLPREVSVRRTGAIRTISTEELSVGDAILVAPGGRIPVDGVVLSGHSFADESRITGESMPVEKLEGARVFAGSINQSGALELRAERIGRDTSYGKIIEAVERAERSRAPVQRLADRLAGYLVYFALTSAALTYLITQDIRATIAVVIVAGACGIAAGTPLAVLGGIGRSARLGAIIKGGVHLETLGKVDTVVMDKTGTLTFGRPEVRAVTPEPGVEADDLLDAAVTAEVRSEHPLGKAILAHAQVKGRSVSEPESFDYTPGRGISAVIDGTAILVGNRAWMNDNKVAVSTETAADVASSAASEVLVAKDGRLLGTITVADTVRPEARQAVAELQAMGIRAILLTGDNRTVAQAIGSQLGLKEIEAELLPEDKLDRIQALVRDKRVVAMVGDGVNDAPALAESNVGVAMGSGTDVAQESADIVLLGNDLARFVETIKVARRTRGIIWQNFAGTIGIDVIGVVLAAMGLLGPLGAAFVHVASEMVFILNSARLLPQVSHRSETAIPGRVLAENSVVHSPAARPHG
ncbi:heavy metal translocating P-type ATPase [Salipiger thiooxidans]|uniref:heavy metal translocating P-type ATPase n=1 Tax=Salipiger thiooxidans TaxID=282683 RepID=UPI001CD58866|nr:cation-translocating P-type ATPase [Salipiger thiooxidans]MCA0850676.1 cadmium-translocating P-type ATPase [Salipiger thiooxidans]